MAVTTFEGAPLYLRDSQWASKFFGGTQMLKQPKRPFTFVAGFVPNSRVVSKQFIREYLNDNLFLVKSFSPPEIDIDTEVYDQYNKKRVIQKRINYPPVSITLHDDVDNRIFAMIMDYIRCYYRDSVNVDRTEWRLDTVSEFINQNNWGFVPGPEKYYFSSMFVAWVNAGALTFLNLRNPIISNIEFSNLDYSDSQPLEITMSVEYEGWVPRNINTPLVAELANNNAPLQLVRNALLETEEIGQFFEGPNPGRAVRGLDRTPGLGEILSEGLTFFQKHNGKPTIEDAVEDFVIRPVLGQASGVLNSWGNFNFGGVGSTRGGGGLLGGVGNAVGAPFKFVSSGGVVNNIFNFGSTGNSGVGGDASTGDERANERFLISTGIGEKLSGLS